MGRSAPPCAPDDMIWVIPDDMVWMIWKTTEWPSVGMEKKREYKRNERAGLLRIRPVGHVWGSAPWCTRHERMGHVGGRSSGVSVMLQINFHVM
ncbi:hypothetical protein JCGZ_24206 [Jatropha curcas]|uniref:Uncharacterized protein n=1 Tax=Jatropha curcas TaxID=180498 RepID=A0A067LFL8_JATCU|nr:hypothetical protein JCGZ_24206 [Jatropha curcas]